MAAPVESASSYLPARLMVGALQGIGLALLAAQHSMTASALTMALLFAPLLLLAGLGRVPGKLLLPWTAIAAIALAASGAYQYWRGGEIDASSACLGGNRPVRGPGAGDGLGPDGKPLAAYPAFHFSAWPLAIQVAVCGIRAPLWPHWQAAPRAICCVSILPACM